MLAQKANQESVCLMDAVILHPSPSKRKRVCSPATKFPASPLSISKEDALRLKREDKDHVQLRYISSEAISEHDAINETPKGFQVCVSPHRSGTNMLTDLLAKQQRLDSMELYFNALYTSVPVCAADLTMVSVYVLDYHMCRLYIEKKRRTVDPKQYQAIFVGKGKGKPFKGTSGDQIRYVFLLKCWLKLSKGNGSGTEDDDVTQKLPHFEDLLASCEGCLVATSSYCGYGSPNISVIRKEALDFYEGDEKKTRDVGSHVFTHMFYQQKRTPLEKQCLEDPFLPPENDSVFNMKEPGALLNIGLKVLALVDLEKRLSAPPSSPNRLKTSAPTLTQVGGNLVKYFIKVKGKLNESIEFQYGSLKAIVEVDVTKPIKVFDLLSEGNESGGSLGG